MSSPQRLGQLIIANGAVISNEFNRDVTRNCRSLVLVSLDAALTGVVTVTSADEDVGPTVFRAVQSPPGTDITLAAAKAVVLTAAPFPRFRLSSTLAEGAARTWTVWGEVGE